MTETLGERVRRKRKLKGISMRGFAKLIGHSPTYMSFVETKIDGLIPSEETICKIALQLDDNKDELLALCGKISTDIKNTIIRHPKEISQFLRLTQSFDQDKWISLTQQIAKQDG